MLAKDYSQAYNDKSRRLYIIHSMIHELMHGVIFVEFVRSKFNSTDCVTKRLRRDLVNKSVIGMGLKSTINLWY